MNGQDPGTSDAHDDPAIAAAFLDRYMRDLQGTGIRELADYQALFAGHEDLVRREYEALARPLTTQEDVAASSSGEVPTLAHYELLEEIGRGGQGRVYRARDTRLKRIVAIKVLDVIGQHDEQGMARFRREAEVASRLDHPGICAVLDSGVADGRTYIAMRLVEGQSLAETMADLRPDDRAGFQRVLELFENAARAVHVAHEAGIVHRDIKPGNIMVSARGDPVLLDFGLARDDDAEAMRLTQTGDVFGTPAYMPPEQLRGQGVDARSDVYSLGATLYECLTTRTPFSTESRETLFRAILDHEPVPPQVWNRQIPQDLGVVVLTALEKEPDRRYPTALAFAEDLARVRKFEPIRARPVSVATRARRWVQRNRAVALLACALFVVLTASLIVIYQKNIDLATELEDANAGRLTKFQREVERRIEAGFQKLFSANPTGAAEMFDDVLAMDARNKTAMAGRFWAQLDFEPDKALAALARFESRLPDDSDLTWMRGLAEEGAGKPDRARALFDAAGSSATDIRSYLEGLRIVKTFRRRDPSAARRAIEHFETAILKSARPRFHYFHSLLMAAAYAGDQASMKRAAKLLEHHWPESPATLEAIARFFLSSDPARAERALRALISKSQQGAPRLGMAQLELNRGNEREAERWFTEALEVEPDYAAAWFSRAMYWQRAGNGAKAMGDLREALRRDARMYPAALQLASLLVEDGRKDEAIGVLEAALSAFPKQRALMQMLERIRG